MTTEDDFQAALDDNPDDWQTRLVFADWLDERDDPRAEGYRALGRGRFRPCRTSRQIPSAGGELTKVVCWVWYFTETGKPVGAQLKTVWWDRLGSRTLNDSVFDSRRAADDAAALAFSLIPPAIRHRVYG